MSILAYLAELRRATLDARKRLGDKNVAVRVKTGRFDVVRLSFVKSKCTETVISGGLTMAGAVEFLDAMQPEAIEA